MDNATRDRLFQAVWARFSEQNQIANISCEDVELFAIKKGLTVRKIKEVQFGFSRTINGILLETSTGKALYPRQRVENIDIYNRNKQACQNYEDFWRAVDWFFPPYIPRGKMNDAISLTGISILEHSSKNKKYLQERFEYSLPSLYDFSNIVPITVQTLSESQVIGKHLPIITESIIAFYSGMKVVAIGALIPIIEDILGSMIGEIGTKSTLRNKVDKCIDQACERVVKLHIEDADWIPEEFVEKPVLKVMNERIFILETMRHWLKNSFYKNTKKYDNHSGFNRHFFAHAGSDVWQNQSNFFRAMGLIQALAFIECFAVEGSTVSIFAPNPDERSESFRNELFACLNMQVFKMQILSKMQMENNLPFNPTSSDDGWLRRASILSDGMSSEIIARLRDKEWQCHSFTDPIKNGEYITVNAKKGSRDIKIALLYSCASDNELYRELDKSCDYILYLGSYYQQESFARGVKTTVLPLNAWITPE
ncbi:MAG: hypothetical protein WD185_00980 [Sneathiella sp.]